MKNLFYILVLFGFFSCKKDPKSVEPEKPVEIYNPPAPANNSVTINITNMSDNAVLKISKDTVYTGMTPKYINANGDTFSVSIFKYYISNIKFKKSDGSYYIEPDSYYLINASDSVSSCKLNIKNVPYGEYVAIEYIIGVDSTRNCSGAQSGALAATNDMFWSWNQGYIFFKFEGYTSSGVQSNIHNLEYHIGGFKAPYNNIRKVILPLNSPSLIVSKTKVSKIYLKTDIQYCFKNLLSNINFSALQVVAAPSSGGVIANNYVNMFSVASVVN